MKVSIIPVDNIVVINGRAIKVDMEGVDGSIRAVQFDSKTGVGEIEYNEDNRRNEMISNIDQFMFLRDRYESAVAEEEITQTDPYYKATVEEARVIKYAEIGVLAESERCKNRVMTAGALSTGSSQTIEHLLLYALSCIATGDGNRAITVILADLNPDGTPKRIAMTASAVAGYIKEMLAKNETINQSEQDEKDKISLLNSVAAIKAQPIPTENSTNNHRE